MTLADVSLLAVRLLALYVIAQGIGVLPSLAALPPISDSDYGVTRSVWIAYRLATILPLCLGLLALLFSRAIARRLTSHRTEDADIPSAARAGVRDMQSAAIGTFGLLLLAVALPRLLAAIAFRSSPSRFDDEEVGLFEDPYVVTQLATVVMALLLCIGSGFWVRLLRRFRDLGWKEG